MLTFEQFFVGGWVNIATSKGLARPVPHPEQLKLIRAIDAADANGNRLYTRVAASYRKKDGKSLTLAAAGAWHVCFDKRAGPERLAVITAGDLDQSRSNVFRAAVSIVRRHPWLAKNCRIFRSEIVFSETVRDERTGGLYTEDHVLRALAAGDVRGAHGLDVSLHLADECWVYDEADVFEALALPPHRPNAFQLLASYAPLASQPKTTPWNRVLEAGRAGTDPRLFFSELTGDDPSVPWVTPAWREQQRRILPAPKFARIIENRAAAGSECAFLTPEEISDAIDWTWREPTEGRPGVKYVAGLDLAVSFDWASFAVGRIELGVFYLERLMWWTGTRAKPISFTAIEQHVLEVSRRFRLSKVQVDAWSAHGMCERLQREGVPVELVTIAPSVLDKLSTGLKTAFAARMIRIPPIRELREQLEALEIKEQRRGLVRLDSGSGATAAARHDDLAMATALALSVVVKDVGRRTLPAFQCHYVNIRRNVGCALWGGWRFEGSDPVCRACPGFQLVLAEWQKHGAALGLDLRSFAHLYKGTNETTTRFAYEGAIAALGL